MEKTSSVRMIAIAIPSLFLYGSNLSLLGTLVPELSRRLNLNLGQVGTIAAVQAIGLMLGSLCVGPLIDRRGEKGALIVGMGLIALTLLAFSHATGLYSAGGLMLILGLGMAIVLVAGNSLAADVSEDKRGVSVMLANVFYGVGGFFTPFVASHFVRGNRVNLTYFVAGLAALILFLTLLIPLPLPSRKHDSILSSAFRIRGKSLLAMLSLFALFCVACEVAFWDFLPKYLGSVGIQTDRALEIVAVGFGLGIVAGRIVSIGIVSRLSSHTMTLGGSLLLILMSSLLLKTSDPTVTAFIVFCLGFAMGPIMPCALAMVGDAFPQRIGTCIGVVVTAGFFGASIITRVIGALSEATTLRAALMLIPALAVLMVVIDIVLKPMLDRARTQLPVLDCLEVGR